MTDIAEQKRRLRRDLRGRRAAFVAGLTDADRARAFSIAPSPLRMLMDGAAIVGSYMPVGDEADPSGLTAGRLTALPWFKDRNSQMVFRLWRGGVPLEPDPFGTMQASACAPLATPHIILLPLIGFDRQLGRIGQGAAHYDRYLAEWPDALRVGIAWSAQETDAIPCEAHDMTLDAVLTEREWIERKEPRS